MREATPLRLRFLRSVAAIMLVLGGMTVAVPAAATPMSPTCTHPAWSDKDKSGSGYGNSSSTPIHTGPYGACAVVATVGSGVLLYYHCYVSNSYGNTWTHVRISGTNIGGWVYDGNLNDYGSSTTADRHRRPGRDGPGRLTGTARRGSAGR